MFQGKLGQLHIFKIEKDKGKPSLFFLGWRCCFLSLQIPYHHKEAQKVTLAVLAPYS